MQRKIFFLLLIVIPAFRINVSAQMLTPFFKTRTPEAAPEILNDSNKNEKQPANILPKVHLYALGSVNSAENTIETVTATGRFAAEMDILPNLSLTLAANVLNANPSVKIRKDSVDFNGLMFPETGNFGFLLSPSIRLWPLHQSNSTHSLYLDGTYTFRKMSIDSPNISFKVNSVNLGLKYRWLTFVDSDEDPFVFTLAGYWNFFNVPDEDVSKFNLLINDSVFQKVNKNAELYSLGLKTTIQYKNFLFFADLRRNIGTKTLDDNSPFKGTKFNIGIATLLRLKRKNED